MNYHLAHTTTYEYSGSVSLSHHLVRLQPRQLPHQHCLGNRLEIHPPPSVVQPRLDYFGNQMTFVTVEGSHRNLVVVSRSEVEIEASPTPAPEKTPAWETVAELCAAEKPNGVVGEREFTYASPHIKRQEDFADYARPAFTPQRPLLEAVLDLTGSIHRDFKFDSKSTTVATPLEEVFKSRRGVCQDFAHLEIACLRSLGLPARYVSGYLETLPPPGKPRLAGADASHAWVSIFSPGSGWIDLDPTNNLMPANRHITIAWGRDYSDVSPIRGVILGSGEHSLKVAVDVIPVDAPRLPL